MSAIVAMFLTVFLAELGDKTQLATILFATEEQHSAWLVFAVASAALVLSTAIAVILGRLGATYLTAIPLDLIAGIGFIAIGAWTIWGHFSTA